MTGKGRRKPDTTEKKSTFISATMSQTETNLLSIQRTVKRLKQMREKEMQLCNQLEAICQRQCKAQRRNQDLLRDYKRIEQELACLAAKTNHFRINQVNYMKQSQPILPAHYECFAPSSCTVSHVKQTYNANNYNLPVNCGNFAGPRHFKEYPDHFCQAARNHTLFPDHLIRPQGSTCCCSMYHHYDKCSEPDKSIFPVSMQGNGAQKNRHSTNDLFLKDYSFNKKDTTISLFPDEIYNTGRERIMPQPKALRHICNINMYGGSSKMFPLGAQERTVGDEVKASVRKSSEDNIRSISALHQEVPPNFINEEQKRSQGSICKLQHPPSALTSPKHEKDHENNTVNKGMRKLGTQQVYQMSPREQSSEQNLMFESCMEIHNTNCPIEKWSSLGGENINCDEKKMEGKSEEDKEKDFISNKNGKMAQTSHKSFEEIRVEHNSNIEQIGEEEPQPITKHLSYQIAFNKSAKDGNVDILRGAGDGLFEENNDSEETSDSIDSKWLKGEKKHKLKNLTTVENEMLCRQQSFGNYQNPKERNDQSDSSEKNSVESNSGWLICDTSVVMKDRENVSGRAIAKPNTPSKDKDEKETEGKVCEGNESENEELENYEVMEILQGKHLKTRITKSREIKNCLTYREATEKNSNTEKEDDEECISEKYSGLQLPNTAAVNDGEITDTKESKVSENDSENTDDDDEDDEDDQDDEESISEKYSGLQLATTAAVKDGEIKDTKESKVHESDSENDDDEEEEEEDDEDDQDDEKSISENYSGLEMVSTVAVKDGEIKDTKESKVHESENTDVDDDEDDDEENGGRTGDSIQKKDINGEICSIDAYDSEAISEEEESENTFSSGEQSLCEDQDEEDIDLLEKEENDDLLASSHNQSELVDKLSKNLSLKKMSMNGDLQTSSRKGSSHLGEQASIEGLKEDENTYTENERSFWLCCLKSCSLSQTCNKSKEIQKRCSEDMTMGLLQLNPVESGSSFPDQGLPASPTLSRNTEVASVLKAPSEDSSEELSENGEKAENLHQSWSDSEDDVHSFYD